MEKTLALFPGESDYSTLDTIKNINVFQLFSFFVFIDLLYYTLMMMIDDNALGKMCLIKINHSKLYLSNPSPKMFFVIILHQMQSDFVTFACAK